MNMTRKEILQAAIRNEYEKFDCVNISAMQKKLQRDYPRQIFHKQEIENVLMEDSFFEDRHGEWKAGRLLHSKEVTGGKR
jgi:hypothetical protein